MIGKMISHYRVIEQITGTMGEAYLAEDTRFGRKVVLKLYGAISDPSSAQEVFKREAIVASLIDHPNIRVVYGVDEYEGSPLIVMEYLKGATLERRLAKGPLELKRILEIGIQIAEALEELHSTGIIHRNINSANIFLTVDGPAKLCDFTLATTVQAEKNRKSEPQVVETIINTSPEQLMGEPVGTSTDIFSFGAVIYEMVAGFHPFQKETIEATTRAVLKKRPARISHRKKVPRLLRKTIAQMLAKDPKKRLASAHELQARLEEIRGHLTHER